MQLKKKQTMESAPVTEDYLPDGDVSKYELQTQQTAECASNFVSFHSSFSAHFDMSDKVCDNNMLMPGVNGLVDSCPHVGHNFASKFDEAYFLELELQLEEEELRLKRKR
ncbi:MAG: hypothetical protein ACRCTW_10235, partial [Lactococcus garvieae]